MASSENQSKAATAISPSSSEPGSLESSGRGIADGYDFDLEKTELKRHRLLPFRRVAASKAEGEETTSEEEEE
jgi:hypothetical protein